MLEVMVDGTKIESKFECQQESSVVQEWIRTWHPVRSNRVLECIVPEFLSFGIGVSVHYV